MYVKYPHFASIKVKTFITHSTIWEETQLGNTFMNTSFGFSRRMIAKLVLNIPYLLSHVVKRLLKPTIIIGHTVRVFWQNLLHRQCRWLGLIP